jgi:DNA-binding transcriptional MerR regulator
VANLLLIGELAKACGVSNDTIRHYEQKGVIPAAVRDGSGYRRYPEETIERVRLVRRALGIGFTLDELARVFRQRTSGHPPCREVRLLGARKLSELDDRIGEMLAVRDALASTLESWDSRLIATPEGEMAHLLETVIERRNK